MDELDKKIEELLPKPIPSKEEKAKGIFAGRDIIINYKSSPVWGAVLAFLCMILFLFFV